MSIHRFLEQTMHPSFNFPNKKTARLVLLHRCISHYMNFNIIMHSSWQGEIYIINNDLFSSGTCLNIHSNCHIYLHISGKTRIRYIVPVSPLEYTWLEALEGRSSSIFTLFLSFICNHPILSSYNLYILIYFHPI